MQKWLLRTWAGIGTGRMPADTIDQIDADAPVRRGPIRWLVMCGVLLIAAIVIGTAITVGEFRERALANSERELENTLLLLTRHFHQQLEQLDLAQQQLAEDINLAGITSGEDLERKMSGQDVHLLLKAKISALPYVSTLNLVGSDGKLINFTHSWPAPPVADVGRDYFKVLKSAPQLTTVLSDPVKSRIAGTWTIKLARKVSAPNGDFLGIIVGTIQLSQFERFFASVALGEGAAIAIFHRDGTLLARHPHSEEMIGRNFMTGPLFQNVVLKANHGTIRLESRIDGLDRLVSAGSLSHFPMVVVVATTVSAALVDWREQTKVLIGVAGLSVLGITAVLFLIARQLSRQHQASQRKLARGKQRLQTAINNMTQGLLLFDSSRRVIVCNQRYIEMYGLSPDVVKPGCSLRDLIAHRIEVGSLQVDDIDAHCARILEHVARDEGTVTNAPDGRSIQVTHRLVSDGGWITTHEDITERLRHESNVLQQAAELARTQEVLTEAVNASPDALVIYDERDRLVTCNEAYRQIYAQSAAAIYPGALFEDVLYCGLENNQYPEAGTTSAQRSAWLAERMRLHRAPSTDVLQHLSNGRWIQLRERRTASGLTVGFRVDVTEIQNKTAELARINMQFDAALSNLSQGICMFDGQKRLVVWNQRFAELYQLPPDLLKVGTPHDTIIKDRITRGLLKGGTSDSAAKAKITALAQLPSDAPSRRVDEFADGRLILIVRQPTKDGGWVATHEDITEQRRAEAEIVHLARHDVLTGLANRAEFNAKLEEASKRLKRNSGAVTLMMLDLDEFKAVNDTLGHLAGDQLLVEVGRRLQSTLRETDVLARLGGDEFAILQKGEANQYEGAIALALRIIGAITEPFDLNGRPASIGTSIGIVFAPEDGVDPEELLRNADLALYEAKVNGRNDYRVFRAEMLEVAQTQRSAESELRNAILGNEFELHYQPVVDTKTRSLCGVEALVRWRHPTKGLVGPDQFIPMAESTGLIGPLGEWVLQRACTDATSWPAHIKVAINISPVQFKKGNLFDVILCALVETGLAPERLELEITETAILENHEAHLTTIRQLKNLGISIALDDFGTGYSSVKYLSVFPFDKIKIDKSFTQGVINRRHCKAIVASTVALAQGLGTVTTAEGVETEEQFDYLRTAGVDLVQGYLFGRPVPIVQLDLHDARLPNEMILALPAAISG
jgi:diguanylate cyclase (GGDEF)-like protein